MKVVPNASELVGRDRELAQVRAMLTGEGRPIVTVWGPGGIGKTSLARAVMRLAPSREKEGEKESERFFCALASARTSGELLAMVGDTLSLSAAPMRSSKDAMARIGRSLAARGPMLLVLDNVEQIVEETALALAAWTLAAPKARFLVTSRSLLAVPGESPCELLPLGLDAREGETPDAVRLLVERARAVWPTFQADPAVLLRIAQRLDGIPLAIELASARLATMSAEQLLTGLDDRFLLLRRDYGGADLRQRRLHDTIDWSWALLGETEQRALEELSVTRGGFDLAAAAAIVSDGAKVPDTVAALRHKSLLARSPSAGTPRFFMLESIRDFAAQKLGERTRAVCDRHAAYFTAQARSWAARVDHDEDALAALTAESENLAAIVERFHESPTNERAAGALEALVSLEPVLTARGESGKLAELFARALQGSAAFPIASALRVRALELRGIALLAVGQLAESEATLTEGLLLTEDDVSRARVLIALGYVRQAQGQLTLAMETEESALVLAKRAGARRETGQCLSSLALIHHVSDSFADGRMRYEESLAIHREVGDVRAEIRTRARLGFLMQDLGEPDRAMEHYAEVIRLEKKHGFRILEGVITGYIGNIIRAEGRITDALAQYDRAVAILRLSGDRRFEATFTMDRGIALLLDEKYPQAILDLDAAGAIASDVGDTKLLALMLGYALVARASLSDLDGARAVEARAREASRKSPSAIELLDLHAAHIFVAEARSGEPKSLARAKAVLGTMGERPFGQHRLIAQALLKRAVERVEPPAGSVVLAGSRLRLPDGTWIDLAPALAGVATLLVTRRLAHPGDVVSIAELVRAGWPGEKIVSTAGANRLRVLVSALRTLGLRELVRSAKGGYFLDSSVAAFVV